MSSATAQSGAAALPRPEWLRLARRARLLSWASLAFMAVEGVVAVAAGLAAGSIALIGFGLDSAIEGFASLVIVWRFTDSRLLSDRAEQRAQRLVAIQFFVLAPYITIEAGRDLIGGSQPEASSVGIALAAVSLVVMPALGLAKQRIGARIGSVATRGEGAQTLLCAYMAAALLIGLAGNAWFGLWWLDPLAALVIAALAVREGVEAWRGESCCAPGSEDRVLAAPELPELPLVACRLDDTALPLQLDRYAELGRTADSIHRRPNELLVEFGPEVDRELLERAVAVERDCCSFLELDYSPAERRLAIAVDDPSGAPALDAIERSLRPAQPTPSR